MSFTTATTTAPFSKAVVNAMRKLYPEALADKSWDNTGLLLESPFDPLRRQMNSVLLTVDLTKAVADEAIERNDSIVVAYHPIIFRGLKSLTSANSQQQSLLRLAAEGISVYCPHTAVDAAPGGLGDWLADIVTGTPATAPENEEGDPEQTDGASSTKPSIPSTPASKPSSLNDDPFQEPKRPVFMLQHHPSQLNVKDGDLKLAATSHERSIIKPNETTEGAGMGRIVRFNKPQPLYAIIERIGRGLGNPKGFPIAIPQGKQIEEMSISSIGICAGSGGSLLNDLDVDLLFTGELSHHEALAAIEKGQCVITLFHSNTERGFLHSVMRTQLLEAVQEEWQKLRGEMKGMEGVSNELLEALEDDYVGVEVSERDRDPYGIVISKAELGEGYVG
ncbi:putative NGG1 interacting factor Nif3 [Aulographum hederae CBS 113979]|uniref:Putative NGG1 interacting factor Nif3 n=1 Tax=Aulographum hederae CBS 113979 TaxID=1176131 RepID=A0A6G1GYL8_9PEZI|nr:putative NGG1 interacting factor Nif3 [Aulographum hederae CBS 113979]